MSIRVPLDELDAALADYPWCYLVSVGADQRAHSLAVAANFADGRFHTAVGRSTRANVAARPGVTLVFPPPSGQQYSLIVDGEAQVQGEAVVVVPTGAVLHRPALAT